MFQLQAPPLKTAAGVLLVILLSLPAYADENRLVDFYTPLGNFRIELYTGLDLAGPGSILYPVLNNRLHSTVFHHADNSRLAGGKYQFNRCAQGLVLNDPWPTSFPASGPELANTKGTIALLRDPHNPAFLTSDWIINLEDSSSADPSTAPVVIGEVVLGFENLLTVRDASQVSMNDISDKVPTINYEGKTEVNCDSFGPDNLVSINMDFRDWSHISSINFYDEVEQLLKIVVDTGEGEIWSLHFQLLSEDPEVVVQGIPGSLIEESYSGDGSAIYDANAGTLVVPELWIDYEEPLRSHELAYRNLVFRLTDESDFGFVLESLEEGALIK